MTRKFHYIAAMVEEMGSQGIQHAQTSQQQGEPRERRVQGQEKGPGCAGERNYGLVRKDEQRAQPAVGKQVKGQRQQPGAAQQEPFAHLRQPIERLDEGDHQQREKDQPADNMRGPEERAGQWKVLPAAQQANTPQTGQQRQPEKRDAPVPGIPQLQDAFRQRPRGEKQRAEGHHTEET